MVIIIKFFFIEDLDIYSNASEWPRWMWPFTIVVYPQTWAIIVYRFGNWIVTKCHFPIIKNILYIVYFILYRIIAILTRIEIGANAKIGRGLYIAHCGTIIICYASEIGDYPMIYHNVTIGMGGRDDRYGSPKIGKNAFIGAGSTVIGKINVGDNVLIGANTLVIRDIPDNAVVGGIPAKILNYKGSQEFIKKRNASNG